MDYFTNLDGLDLFTSPFGSAQASKKDTGTRPQQPKTSVPVQKEPAPPAERAGQPAIPPESVPEKETSAVQMEQPHTENEKVSEPEKKPQEPAHAPVKPQMESQPSADTQKKPKPPEKELSLDMSDHTIPAGKPLEASEDVRRKAHEEAEAKRKAEWEAKQAAKKQAEEAAVQKLQSMSDADIISASEERVRTDVERLTRRNMKECVAEHIQSVCRKDPAFARKTMHPKKSMVHCFKYINRMAREYIEQEMEENGIEQDAGGYGSDVPDGLCYQWAVDYFNDTDAPEDREKEETFVSRPYAGTSSKTKKTPKAKKTDNKKADSKKPEKKQKPENEYQQMSLPGVS